MYGPDRLGSLPWTAASGSCGHACPDGCTCPRPGATPPVDPPCGPGAPGGRPVWNCPTLPSAHAMLLLPTLPHHRLADSKAEYTVPHQDKTSVMQKSCSGAVPSCSDAMLICAAPQNSDRAVWCWPHDSMSWVVSTKWLNRS